MKYFPAILLFFLLPVTIAAQRTIKGRVVNAATGAVIPGSSIFISNTSKGTVSGNNGTFELNDVPPGKHDLVISSIGYETNVFSFSDGQLPLQLKIELAIKVKELENVTLEPSIEEGWEKWGRSFMENFVGTTPNAAHCRIRNEKSIRFRFYKKSNRLIAYCDEPILLENKALGYMINYQLENFEIDFADRSTSYTGYSLFTETGKNESPTQKSARNRRQAYQGSIMHFMRSVYDNRLAEQGFEVRRMQRVTNEEKERVKRAYTASRVTKKDTVTGITMLTHNLSADTASYYQRVMRQDNHRDIIGASLLTADSLVVQEESGNKWIHFEDYLHITYKNEPEEEAFLKAQFLNRRRGFQVSHVVLLGEKVITIDKTGNYYDPQQFLTSVYWGWDEKMANSLPLDYVPAK